MAAAARAEGTLGPRMATLDTLDPQSRAIVELLLRQGKGYDDIARTLDMPAARVRELARDALTSLAPASAGRVDGDWRGQVADYVLGQQTGPEVRATRGHLKRSEAARAWVASLVDSLDPLYGDGDRPEIPEPGGDGAGERRRRRGAASAGAGALAGEPRERLAEGAGARAGTPSEAEAGRRGDEAQPTLAPSPAGESRDYSWTRPTGAQRRELSPESQAIVRRRRIIGGAIAAAALVAALVVAIVLLTGGGDERDRTADRGPSGAQGGAGGQGAQARLVGQAVMRPVGRGRAEGVAVIAERARQFQLLVQARRLRPSGRDSAYEVWLYDSPSDAASLGGQVTDDSGNLQGAGPLPPNFRDYRFIDISRERLDRNPRHSGESVLRVPVADVLRGRPPAGAAGGAGGGAGGAGGGAGGAPAPQP